MSVFFRMEFSINNLEAVLQFKHNAIN